MFSRTSILSKKILNLVSPKRFLTNLEPVSLAYNTYDPPTPGSTPPLIVHHGLFGSKSNWNSLCKVYQKKTGRRIIAVDARNHGDSPHSNQHSYEYLAADLKNLIERLGLGKVALLGHSMGGRAVMFLALSYPEIVEKMIVADISPIKTSPMLDDNREFFDIMEKIELPMEGIMSKVRSVADREMSQFVKDKGLRSFLLTNINQKADGSFGWKINIDSLRRNYGKLAGFPDTDALKYTGDVLFIGGGNSDYIVEEDHPGIKKLFPNAKFEYIQGAGHWLHSEKPQEFLESTIKFLNS